ncbi:MAG: TonB-dependent receptor [Desulfobacterales bacterium]|nr:TonB-dependent receptor [Desulfobacterales bacterium]
MKKLLIIMFFLLQLNCYASEINEDSNKDLSLEKLLNLDISIASKIRQPSNEAPSIVSVITDREIKNMGAKNLEDILKTIAGFDIYPYAWEPSPIVGVRGLFSNTNEVVRLLVNGHPLGNSWQGAMGFWEGFPVVFIKRIEVIRGPGSALYGNSAMIGVINIITKDGKDKSSLSAAYGKFDTYRADGQAAYTIKDADIYVGADFYSSNGDARFVESDYATAIFGPKGSSAPGYTTEGFQYSNLFTQFSYHDFEFNGMLNYSDTDEPLSLQRTLTDDNIRRITNAFADLEYKKSIFKNGSLSMKVYYDYHQWHHDSEFFSEETASLLSKIGLGYPEGENLRAVTNIENYKAGGEANLNYNFVDGLNMLIGFQYEYHDQFNSELSGNFNGVLKNIMIDGQPYIPWQYFEVHNIKNNCSILDDGSSCFFVTNNTRSIFAAYSQISADFFDIFQITGFGDSFSVTAGVRYDEYSDIGSNISPRLGTVYALNDKLYFKLLFGEAFRAPNFRELYIRNNPSQNGNPNLGPENITTFEGLMGFNITRWMTTSLSYFHTEMEDMIVLVPNEFQMGAVFANHGTVKSEGFEGEIRILFDKNKYGYFNMTYQEVKDITHEVIIDKYGTVYKQKDFSIGNIPEIIANWGINMDITRYVNFNLSLNYKGERKRSEKLQFTKNSIDTDGTLEKIDKRDAMDSIIVVNASIIFHNFLWANGLEFQLSGYNIFDEDDRGPEFDGVVANDIPKWGSNFIGKISYSF